MDSACEDWMHCDDLIHTHIHSPVQESSAGFYLIS